MTDASLLEETPAQRWRRRIVKSLLHGAFALVAYGLLVLTARALHRRVLYQPPEGAPAKLPDGASLLRAQATDGVAVSALEFAAPKATRTIVHFHGNAEAADDSAPLARELVKRGFSVVLVEYRGYGRSRGATSTEDGLYADAQAVLDALAARGTTADRIVLWGQALGGGVAAEMARRGRGARLVLVAPLTSTIDLAARIAPFLPLSYVMIDRFDTLAKAPSITLPTLVVHGEADDVIPFEQGQRLSRALPNAKLLDVPEARHDNLYKGTSVIATAAAHAGS